MTTTENIVTRLCPPISLFGQTIVFAATMLVLCANVRAQSVDSLIREAYRNNPQIEALAYQADAAAYRADAAGAMPAPTLGIEFSQVPTNSVNLVNDAVSNNLSLSQMFMLGRKLSAMSGVEKKNRDLLQHTHASLLVKLRTSVTMNYIQLWRLDRQIDIQHRTIRLMDELASAMQSRVQTNRARSADMLTVQAEAASERARLTTLHSQRLATENTLISLTAPPISAKQNMHRSLSLPQESAIEDEPISLTVQQNSALPTSIHTTTESHEKPATMPDSTPPHYTATTQTHIPVGTAHGGLHIIPDSILPALPAHVSDEELSTVLSASNPSLSSMEHMKEINDAMSDAARRELVPDLMLQVMVMRMPNGMVLTSGPRSSAMVRLAADGMAMKSTEWMYSVMASITLPFAPWSSERSTAKADEMRAMSLSIDAERNAMQREMLASLRSAVNTYQTQDSLIQQYRDVILPLTRDAVEAQTAAYQTGQATLSAVLDSYKMELMKTDDYLMAIMNQRMALIDIEMMVGIPIH